jgi:hypothetical protein
MKECNMKMFEYGLAKIMRGQSAIYVRTGEVEHTSPAQILDAVQVYEMPRNL